VTSLPVQLAQIGQRPLFEPGWVLDNTDRIWAATWQHLYLTGMAVGAGLAISMVLSVVALRWRGSYGPIVAGGAVLYTIPSLALFAFLIPFVDRTTNAIIALTTYTILILVRNIVTGVDGVPAEVVEAAEGMGYRPARRFLEVELPLALPVIVAGVRVATVTVIGLVTVASLLGQGGLGQLILTGFRIPATFPTMIVVGVVGSVILAVVFDLALLGVERALTPWARRKAA
jgi:osmoprotectant transport system permease protein